MPAGTPIKYGKSTKAEKCSGTMPSASVPNKGGQTSGEVKHGRGGMKSENLKDMPKNGAAH